MDETKKELENQELNKNTDEFVFMREKIKARPINKTKLARNTLIAAVSAVVFGLVATVTFVLLAPYVSGYIKKDEAKEDKEDPVIIFQETPGEEMPIEDMLVSPTEPEIDYSGLSVMEEDDVRSVVEGIVNQIEFNVSDYQALYQKLYLITKEAQKSVVRVTSVKQGTDWMDNLIAPQSETSGLIVAINDEALYVLTYSAAIRNEDDIAITFSNDTSVWGTLLKKDSNTGLCAIRVLLEDMTEATRKYVVQASFGISNTSYIAGTPVIALGSPLGTYGSFDYGMITAKGTKLTMVDGNYMVIPTDIYASSQATGIVIDLKGNVLGIIESSSISKKGTKTSENMISILGITELKQVIERLVTNEEKPYFGVECTDVPQGATVNYGVPQGVFVLSVETGSPAMNAGIQAGDIIYYFGNKEVTECTDYYLGLYQNAPGDEVWVRAYRQSQDEYKEIEFQVVLENKD